MNLPLIVRPEAEADMTEQALWYEEKKFGLGSEFLEEVNAACRRIQENPRNYRRFRRQPDVRRIISKRFPFRIFYVLKPDAIVVFRVLHGAG